jgi:hypothetical protein
MKKVPEVNMSLQVEQVNPSCDAVWISIFRSIPLSFFKLLPKKCFFRAAQSTTQSKVKEWRGG